MDYLSIAPLAKLIDSFESLPGIGHKTAQRLSYYMLTLSDDEIEDFVNSVKDAHSKIKYCSVCCNLTDKELCKVCADQSRDKSTICVVESPRDVIAFEGTKEYNGLYHVLHGLISPMGGITPEMIHIKELIKRVSNDDIKEVIMATNPTVEGEMTSAYISKLLKPLGIKVSRLAYGIPVGGNLEYADEVTIARALEGRREM